MIRLPDTTDRDLVVAVLRSASDLRMRAARAAAAEVNARADADGKRAAGPDALKVVRIMAEAARLSELADDLERDEVRLMPVIDHAPPPAPAAPPAAKPARKRAAKKAASSPTPAATEVELVDAIPYVAATPAPDTVAAATAAAEAILDREFGAAPTIIPERGDPLAERAVLPAGQGNDDDPDPDLDVAQLAGFDAAVDDSALELILED